MSDSDFEADGYQPRESDSWGKRFAGRMEKSSAMLHKDEQSTRTEGHRTHRRSSPRDDFSDRRGRATEHRRSISPENFRNHASKREERYRSRSPEHRGRYRDSPDRRTEYRRFRSVERETDSRREKNDFRRNRDDGKEGDENRREGRENREFQGEYKGEKRGYSRREEREDLSEDLPEMYSIHHATIKSIRPFGYFVQLEGLKKQALVHLSQVTDFELTKREDSDEAKIEALSSVAELGEKIWVKIVSVKEEGSGNPKIGASMKLVDQKFGEDKDPTNLRVQEERPTWQPPKKFEIEAVLNVTCIRCGGKGHLKTECYADLDRKYDLVPTEDSSVLEKSKRTEEFNESNISSQHKAVIGEPSGRFPGRGRGVAMTQPAWMTRGTPGLGESEVKKFSSREEALALVEKLKKEKKEKRKKMKEKKERRREKKERKERKEKKRKEKKGKEEKEKKEKRRKKSESENDSTSSSESSDFESDIEKKKKSKKI